MSDIRCMYLKPVPGNHLLQKMISIAGIFDPDRPVRISVATSVDDVALQIDARASELAKNKDVIRLLEAFSKSSNLRVMQLRIGSQHQNSCVQYDCLDSIRASIKIVGYSNLESVSRVLEALESAFEFSPYIDIVSTDGVGALETALQLRERAVGDLSDQVRALGAYLSKSAVDTAEFHKKIADEQQKTFEQRLSALEDQYRKRQDVLEQRRQEHDDAIAQREKAFQEKVSGFETHEAKYMRRDLLKKLTEVLRESESLSLSKRTSQKRAWVHVCVGIVLFASFGVAASMGYKIFHATEVNWHVLAPFSAGFVTFALTMVYYLKWNDRWFREHADAEFAAKRYKADIIRASWVAELVSEWAKEGKGDLPPELIAAYTRSLFRDVGTTRVSEHPMDHLTSIMKRATEFDIGKGVFSVRGYKPDSKKSE